VYFSLETDEVSVNDMVVSIIDWFGTIPSAAAPDSNLIECVHGSYRRTLTLRGSYTRTHTHLAGAYVRTIDLTGSVH
jgi:hypothetical protein